MISWVSHGSCLFYFIVADALMAASHQVSEDEFEGESEGG